MRAPANDDRVPDGDRAIGDEDLSAYVAGRLPPDRRNAVEGFLACNPDIAARVMTELHRRGAGPARGHARRRWAALAVGVAACAGSGVLGWQVAASNLADGWREADGGQAPWYVEDALESQAATLARAAMRSQAETPTMDPVEIERTLKLRAPSLPPGWRLIDAQVYPSDDGPGLNIVVEAPSGRRLSLFTVRADEAAPGRPVLAKRGRDAVAYWERGPSAFVLIGDNTGDQLLGEAETLAQRS
jgi:hypothetical protein